VKKELKIVVTITRFSKIFHEKILSKKLYKVCAEESRKI